MTFASNHKFRLTLHITYRRLQSFSNKHPCANTIFATRSIIA